MMLQVGRWSVRRRGLFLALMGVVFVLLGYSLLAVTPVERAAVEHALHPAVSLAPLWVYGVAWIVCGVVSIVDGLRPGVRSALGFTAAVIMPTLWALVYLAAWWQGDLPRGWVSSAVFAALAGAIMIVAGMPQSVRRP